MRGSVGKDSKVRWVFFQLQLKRAGEVVTPQYSFQWGSSDPGLLLVVSKINFGSKFHLDYRKPSKRIRNAPNEEVAVEITFAPK